MGKKRLRADQALVEQGLAPSRAKAQALILAGQVLIGDRRVDKPGTAVTEPENLRLKDQDHPWVSRGGLKLDKALDYFGLDVTDAVALDIGASTGGFTHVLLTRGARCVYAVDVGHGQLAWTLRQDERVVVLERTNARHLSPEHIPVPPTLMVCDASFIGLRTVLPASLALAAPGAHLVALIKPQFEAGRDRVGKNGVVSDPAVHQEVCDAIAAWLASDGSWLVQGVTESPITGPAGNTEFLIAAVKRGA